MLVYLRGGSARAATLRQKSQVNLSISPSRSMLTQGQPVPALTLYRQAPGRVATGVQFLSHWYDDTCTTTTTTTTTTTKRISRAPSHVKHAQLR